MKKLFPFLLCLFIGNTVFARLPDLIPYRKGSLWGYCDSTKRIIIPCQFQEAGLFDYIDSARGVNDEGQSGYIMKNGDFHPDPPPVNYYGYGNYPLGYPIVMTWPLAFYTITTVPYDSCDYYFPVVNDTTSLYGYEDCHHRIVIPCRYGTANSFLEGLASVQDQDGNCFYIDKKGNTKIRFEGCTSAGSFYQGFATVGFSTGTGLINTKGQFLILPLFSSIDVYENLIVASQGDYGRFFIFDKKGKWLFSKTYEEAVQGDDGSFLLKSQDPYSYEYRNTYIDKKGKVIPGGPYRNSLTFSEGLAAVADSSDYWGFINAAGKQVIPNRYSQVYSFSYGLAAVADSTGNWGFIDKKGATRLPFKYNVPENEAGFDYRGLCKISDRGYLDYRGTEYWEE